MTCDGDGGGHLDEGTGLLRGARHAARAHRPSRARARPARAPRARELVGSQQPMQLAGAVALRWRGSGRCDLDPDVAAIFSEEAVELLECGESALPAWNAAPEEEPSICGAARRCTRSRAARAWPASRHGRARARTREPDYTHRERGGRPCGDERARAVVQEALDELSRMREAGSPAGPAGGAARTATDRAHPARIAQRRRHAPPGRRAAPPPLPAAVGASPGHRGAQGCLERRLPRSPAPDHRRRVDAVPAPVLRPRVRSDRDAPAPRMPNRGTAPLPPGREPVAAGERAEMARVDADLLDQLLNNAGEVSISRARLEQQMGSIEFNLGELSRTVTRLKEQLRKLEIETETQILHRHDEETGHRARLRSAGARPLLVDPAVLARTGRVGQRRGQHPETAGEPDRTRRRTCCSSRRAPSPSCRTD